MKVKHSNQYTDGEYDDRIHEVHPTKLEGIFEEAENIVGIRDHLTKVENLLKMCVSFLIDGKLYDTENVTAGVLMDYVIPSIQKIDTELSNL